ncbi:post-transcriptional regulator [Paenibacillus pasadenensis]|nr:MULTISPECIES: post-transcriptional regulator [Paenibacillus]
MTEIHPFREQAGGMSEDEIAAELFVLCESKAEEFRWIGYESVTGPDIWECVHAKYAKSGAPPLYRLVNDILSLKPQQLMHHLTMSAWQNP